MSRGLGWRPDKPDFRDHVYPVRMPRVARPSRADLRTGSMPPVYDQGDLGSCTANAIAAAVQFDRLKQQLGNAGEVPSRLMIYYLEREMENSIDSDAGAEIRDGIKAMNATGACFESGPDSWPYTIPRFTEKPPAPCYAVAKTDEALSYARVDRSLDSLCGCIVEGFPIVIGFTVYSSFMGDDVAKTGVMPMPDLSEQVEGGHAVLVVGYDDATSRFTVRNSWGLGWGDKGYFYMPYEYLLDANLSDDFWTIRVVGAGA